MNLRTTDPFFGEGWGEFIKAKVNYLIEVHCSCRHAKATDKVQFYLSASNCRFVRCGATHGSEPRAEWTLFQLPCSFPIG
jgi:hypothetical protein